MLLAAGLLGMAGAARAQAAADLLAQPVGNVFEWVADWVPRSTACVPSLFGSGDQNCLVGASTAAGPGALLRGGFFGGPCLRPASS